MFSGIDIIDGWQLRPSGDGGFGVYDTHGMIAGPFGTRGEAFAAALKLPSMGAVNRRLRPVRTGEFDAVETCRVDDDVQTADTPRVTRHRVLRPEVTVSKKVRTSLVPLHRRIGRWQTRATFVAARVNGRSADPTAIRTEAEAVIEEVRGGKAALQDLIRRLPEAAASSRVFDTRAALERIESEMRRILGSNPSDRVTG